MGLLVVYVFPHTLAPYNVCALTTYTYTYLPSTKEGVETKNYKMKTITLYNLCWYIWKTLSMLYMSACRRLCVCAHAMYTLGIMDERRKITLFCHVHLYFAPINQPPTISQYKVCFDVNGLGLYGRLRKGAQFVCVCARARAKVRQMWGFSDTFHLQYTWAA